MRPGFFHVRKRTLLAIAGSVWLIAGFNVARLGILAYQDIMPVSAVQILLSGVVFCAFGGMFFGMTRKHENRIKGYKEEFRPVYQFFDLKSYLIMAVMMGGGDLGCVPQVLLRKYLLQCFTQAAGCALALARRDVLEIVLVCLNRFPVS